MKFWDIHNLIENSKNYILRSITYRDLDPQISGLSRLLNGSKHDYFQDKSAEEIIPLLKTMINPQTMFTRIVADATNNDKIYGILIREIKYNKGEKYIEVPLVVGDDPTVVDMLFNDLMKKNSGFMIYIRSHYDPVILNSLKNRGFKIETHGEFILASYPISHTHQQNLFQQTKPFNQIPNQNSRSEEPENDSNNFGLFDDMPWKDSQ